MESLTTRVLAAGNELRSLLRAIENASLPAEQRRRVLGVLQAVLDALRREAWRLSHKLGMYQPALGSQDLVDRVLHIMDARPDNTPGGASSSDASPKERKTA